MRHEIARGVVEIDVPGAWSRDVARAEIVERAGRGIERIGRGKGAQADHVTTAAAGSPFSRRGRRSSRALARG